MRKKNSNKFVLIFIIENLERIKDFYTKFKIKDNKKILIIKK